LQKHSVNFPAKLDAPPKKCYQNISKKSVLSVTREREIM